MSTPTDRIMTDHEASGEHCVCGAGGILADTEDWSSCLCLRCWLALGSPEFEPRSPLRRIREMERYRERDADAPLGGPLVRRARLSCGHWVFVPPDRERATLRANVGGAWPCARCR